MVSFPQSLRKPLPWIVLALILAVAAIYVQVYRHDFIAYDDDAYVTENPRVRSGLDAANVLWALSATHASNWHPLTWFSHMLDAELFGMNPAGHHLSNVLLHGANTLLLFFLLRRLTGSLWPSAFVAALFAVHPLHVQPVAWVAERKEVLSALLGFATLWFYAGYVREKNRRAYVLALILFALSLTAKPMWVTLPLVLLLLDLWPLDRFASPVTPPLRPGGRLPEETAGAGSKGTMKTTGVKKNISTESRSTLTVDLLLEKVPFVLLAVISAMATFIVQSQEGSVKSLDLYPPGVRFAQAVTAYGKYLWLTLWPEKLAILYPYPRTVLFWPLAASTAFLAAMTAAAFWLRRRAPYLPTGWLWFLITLLPVIGLVQVGGQALADRYTYLPLVGIFIALVWGAADGLRRAPRCRAVILPAAALLLVGYGLWSWHQVSYWKSSERLFTRALEVTEGNYAIHNNLGVLLKKQGRLDEAARHFEQALAIRPSLDQAHYNLATVLQVQGNTAAASEHFAEALRIEPRSPAALAGLADAALARGREEEALALYGESLRINPDQASVCYNLGNIWAGRKNLSEAERWYREALRISPNHARSQNNLGMVLLLRGEKSEAARLFRRAVEIQPDYEMARRNLRDVEGRVGD